MDTIFISSTDGTVPPIVVRPLSGGVGVVPGRGMLLDGGPAWGIVADEPLSASGEVRLYVPRLGDRFYVRAAAGIGWADEVALMLQSDGRFGWADDMPKQVQVEDPENLLAIQYNVSWEDFLAPVRVIG
ncbi:hypothetical protein L537_3354 [Bordetella hinzii 1277]|nr:hypothetical protein L537_3354 [Bordetella hinzii 1277]